MKVMHSRAKGGSVDAHRFQVSVLYVLGNWLTEGDISFAAKVSVGLRWNGLFLYGLLHLFQQRYPVRMVGVHTYTARQLGSLGGGNEGLMGTRKYRAMNPCLVTCY